MLTRNYDVPIYQKYLNAMVTKIYKILTYINSDFTKPYFISKEMSCNLRNKCALKLPSPAHSVCNGINSVTFRACLLWNRLSLSAKQSQSLLEFKTKIKTQRNIECSCTICGARYFSYEIWIASLQLRCSLFSRVGF